MNRTLLGVVAALVALGSASCACTPNPTPDAGPKDAGEMDAGFDGGSDAGFDAGVPVPSLAQACARALPSLCQFYVRCGVAETQAGCEELFGRQLPLSACGALEQLALDAGRATFDGSRVGRCLGGLEANYACNLLDGITPADCKRLVDGAVTSGGTCYGDLECQDAANNYCSSYAFSSCPGTCKARIAVGQPVTATEECVEPNYPKNGNCFALRDFTRACGAILPDPSQLKCAEGLYCDISNSCSKHLGPGGSCFAQKDCAAPLVCVGASVPKLCTAPAGLGAACGRDGKLPPCKVGGRCSAWSNGTCQAVSAAAGPCFSDVDCQVPLFCDGTVFETDGGVTPGQCAARRGAGGACAPGSCSVTAYWHPSWWVEPQACHLGSQCQDGLFCSAGADGGGTCTVTQAGGQSCGGSTDCRDGLWCDGGTCQSLQCGL